uniref:Uncharacterized protein n=1 Tax=Romanomermis culicivorax TaxID=13658 RepID=A0A915HK53_ROMCU
MAIKANGARVGIATVVGGIAAARGQSVCNPSGERGLTPRGGNCVAINNGWSDGKPVGGSGCGGNKFHWARKSCQHNRGTG